ncbi:MAG TPA: T9SS type A sorting domain-containing protein [Bacteroidales bacterium]|nr:T9SS type A sorting domain-containing protein [Bacteroidales bacterium]
MKKSIIIITFICLILSSLISTAQSWHTYFGDTLHINNDPCPGHCPYVDVLYVDHDTIFMTGAFSHAGELGLWCLGKWNNFNWYNIGIIDSWGNGPMYCSIRYENKLWVGGSNSWYPNNMTDLSFLSCWDGSSWTGPYTTKPNGNVYDLIEHNDTLFACGDFYEIDGVGGGATVKAYYDGTWISIGHVEVAHGMAFEVFNNELLLGTRYTGIYKRVGMSSWPSFQGSPIGSVTSLIVDTTNNQLYIGGAFHYVDNTIYSKGVAMFDSFKWHSVNNGVYGINPKAMTMYRGDLYVGGLFDTTVNGLTVNHIARWDGYNWHSLGNGTNASVNALAVFQDTLIVGGWFYEVGDSQRALAIAKWYMPDYGSHLPQGCDYLRPIVYAYEEFGTAKDTFYLTDGEAEVKFYNNNAYVDSWEWDFTSTSSVTIPPSTERNPVVTFTEVGEYNVQVTVTQEGCTKTANRTIYIQLGSEIQNLEEPEMQLYPNPTNNDFTVKVFLASYKNVEFKITGINGEQKENIKITGETTVISTKGWKAGVYVCNLFVDGKLVKVEKVVFE